jgi:hypothetical protein
MVDRMNSALTFRGLQHTQAAKINKNRTCYFFGGVGV